MRDPFNPPTPLRNTIRHDPARPTKVEAKREAHRRRLERAEQAQRYEPSPRRFRELSPQERIAFLRQRKRLEERR